MEAAGTSPPRPADPAPPRRPHKPVPAPNPAQIFDAIPGRLRSALGELAGMSYLFIEAAKHSLRNPKIYRRELVLEVSKIVRRCTAPLMLAVFFFGFATIGVQAGGVFEALGATDRVGQIYITGGVRELSTWATAMVVAGIGGTAICADLGSRKIREELDALRVLGVNPLPALVVPRVLAMMILTPVMNMLGILAILISGFLASGMLFESTQASFVESLGANFAPVELFASVLKTMIFGIIIAVVSCYKGLTAKGGAQGVGRAVNEAVVIAFVALWVVNFAITSVVLASFPELQGLR